MEKESLGPKTFGPSLLDRIDRLRRKRKHVVMFTFELRDHY